MLPHAHVFSKIVDPLDSTIDLAVILPWLSHLLVRPDEVIECACANVAFMLTFDRA
jgi:hypothetical protein